jgi:glycine C-acetyltransferase/8-amino-7-oxononanoate synthase
VACDEQTARHLRCASRAFLFLTAPPPPALAGALAALELLRARPELVRRLQANAAALRRELARADVEATGDETHILALTLGDPGCAMSAAAAALEQGVFVHAVAPPVVSASAAGLRLSVMASHRPEELREAGRKLGPIVRQRGPRAQRLGEYRGEDGMFDLAPARPRSTRTIDMDGPSGGVGIFDLEEAPPRKAGIFDLEADDRLAA